MLLGLKVVLVEDDFNLRQMIEMILTRERADVASFSSIADAMKHDWTDVRVVVVDWRMGDEVGTDLLKWLREHHRHVHLVMLTAMPERALIEFEGGKDQGFEIVSKGGDHRGNFPYNLLTVLRRYK